MQKTNLANIANGQSSQTISNILQNNDRNKSKRTVFAVIIILLQIVLAYFSFQGAEFVIPGTGRMISVICSAVAIFFTVAVWKEWIPAKFKIAILIAELLVMSYNAYVMRGLFGRDNIITQAEKLLDNRLDANKKFVGEINSYWQSAKSFSDKAAQIAAIEEKRDGKGIVYQTAVSASAEAGKARTIETVKMSVANTTNSLQEMNEGLITNYKAIMEQEVKQLAEVGGFKDQIKASYATFSSVLAKGGLSPQQTANLQQLVDGTKGLVDKQLPKPLETGLTLKESDLQIPTMKKALPFILEGFAILFIAILVFGLSNKTSLAANEMVEVEKEIATNEISKTGLIVDGELPSEVETVKISELAAAGANLRGKNLSDILKLLKKRSNKDIVELCHADLSGEQWENIVNGNSNLSAETYKTLNELGAKYDAKILDALKPKEEIPGYWNVVNSFLHAFNGLPVTNAKQQLLDEKFLSSMTPEVAEVMAPLWIQTNPARFSQHAKTWSPNETSVVEEWMKIGLMNDPQMKTLVSHVLNGTPDIFNALIGFYNKAVENANDPANVIVKQIAVNMDTVHSMLNTKGKPELIEKMGSVFDLK